MSRAKKSPKAPGKAHRDGISLFDLERMFPDEAAAEHWLEKARWGDEDRPCPYCGSIGTYRVKSRKPLPFRCRDCKRYFSVRVGTPLERSHIPLRKWVYGIYIWMTSLKGVSSMKLHRDLDISQRSAWFMAHRLREAFAFGGGFFSGPVEIDEVYMGGKYRNMSKKRRKTMSGRGRGSGGKSTIVGIKDRPTKQVAAQVVPNLKGETLRAYIMERIHPETTVYTDELRVYGSLNFEVHETVRHGINEYVRGTLTPTGSNRSGQCSSGRIPGLSTRFPQNTSTSISQNLSDATICETRTRLRRWRSLLPGWAGIGCCTRTSLPKFLPNVNRCYYAAYDGGGGTRTHEVVTPARFKVGCHYP